MEGHSLMCIAGMFGVVGLVWALRVIAGSIERLNARLEELSKLLQQFNARLEELSKPLQQFNEKVNDIARKTDDIHQIIGQGARSKDIGPPEAEVTRSNHYKGHSSEGNTQTGNRIPGNADRTTGSKDSQISMKEEELHRPASPFEGKSDKSLVTEVEYSVRMLNAHVDQASCAIAELVCHRESPISSKESEDVLNELCYIEPLLCNKLRSKLNTEHASDRLMITRTVLQSGLIKACSHIINHGSPPSNGATLSRTHSDTVETAVADTSQNECCEIYRKYLARIALKLITAVGGSLESRGALLPRYSDVFDETVKTSLTLHKSVSEAATSMELVTYTIPRNTDFDHSQMENTEEGRNETTQDTVICTVEMGLRCRKRNESSSEEEWEVVNKAQVVLASTLDA